MDQIAPVAQPRLVWLLGRDGYQRVCLRFWCLTSGVYTVLLLLQAYSVTVGLITAEHALLIRATAIVGLATFFVVMRAGWNRHFNDPAMTAQQMAFALGILAMCYVLTPSLRASLLIVTPLVLVFGAFTLTPRMCRQLGGFAVAMQAVAMVLSLQLHLEGNDVHPEAIIFVGCAVVFTMTGEMAARLSALREQLRVQKRELRLALERNELLARQDELTLLPNRRHALEMMEYEGRRAKRDKVPPCICMLDIDHFKRINDTYGHAAGDKVLRLFASHAIPALRGPDILARWGGEEFILLMPETSVADAVLAVERLRTNFAHAHIWADHPELQVTFSAGIAAHQSGAPIQETVARADAALYRAKQEGRNRTLQA